jgi:hypothetical protein
MFQDNIIERGCQKVQDKSEERSVQNITRLIVPSVETFVTFGAKELEILFENVNEGWNNSVER